MGNKISYALKKCKSIFIIILVLWILLTFIVTAPMTVAFIEKQKTSGDFVELVIQSFSDMSGSIGKAFSSDYISAFIKTDLFLLIILSFFGIVGILKTLPKHEYQDIEHGSSDWANGEEYSVLSKNKGILLAEKHYLPVDKRGNTNVLVVGRFRFW